MREMMINCNAVIWVAGLLVCWWCAVPGVGCAAGWAAGCWGAAQVKSFWEFLVPKWSHYMVIITYSLLVDSLIIREGWLG